ncbi:hypothetical protein ColTof4_14083 [Colletotrichum tofieldiae]|uniref:Uncharacterized protein n=1 Tax=Colletotrichum tofieldiae TaxID=708197 RepID=A0A166WKB3_9PEZI|nr:hypothetical protein CT0861_05361 [Colletotrichum tofieldiae]GKT55662.1 hypothetical protein ColTof3_03001 [Colletotrichum tofieldiae]GKT81660.1 hypothetical protein ColTof4_14083 [Colletotrichum tofieldiae]
MASTTPQQGSVSTGSPTAKTVTPQEERSQSGARMEAFLSYQALGRGRGPAPQQHSLAPVAAAVAHVDRLGLGSGGAGAGGTVGQPVTDVSADLHGVGSQFSK